MRFSVNGFFVQCVGSGMLRIEIKLIAVEKCNKTSGFSVATQKIRKVIRDKEKKGSEKRDNNGGNNGCSQ